MKRRMMFLVFSVLSIMILVQGIPVVAHSPSGNSIEYDFVNEELSVVFSHSVTDVNTHYIYQIVVEINSVEVLTRDYTSQNTTASLSAVYSLVAVTGDYIEVTAKCVISGQYTQVLDLSTTTTTTTTSTSNGTPIDTTLIIGIAIVVIAIIAVVVALMKRR